MGLANSIPYETGKNGGHAEKISQPQPQSPFDFGNIPGRRPDAPGLAGTVRSFRDRIENTLLKFQHDRLVRPVLKDCFAALFCTLCSASARS
jgi:hypothetical protein